MTQNFLFQKIFCFSQLQTEHLADFCLPGTVQPNRGVRPFKQLIIMQRSAAEVCSSALGARKRGD